MNDSERLDDMSKDLIDGYLEETLDEASFRALEEQLRGSSTARAYFVRYCQQRTELAVQARATRSAERSLLRIDEASSRRRTWSGWIAAAVVLAVVGFGAWQSMSALRPAAAVAWLVNAQDCRWAAGAEGPGDLQPGLSVRLESGLAEFHFRSGTTAIIEGPAEIEFVSGSSARLRQGKVFVRADEGAAGFVLLSPHGRVVDFGKGFCVAIADGAHEVVTVVDGAVDAQGGSSKSASVRLTKDQSARIGDEGIEIQQDATPAQRFVRAIVPPPVIVPRTVTFDFRETVGGTIRDANGHGTGLTHRLPGTGGDLPDNDPNLVLNVGKRQLELLTTESDLNTQFKLGRGEYLGVRLADFGFTGKEDFEVSASFPNLPALRSVGQLGLYAGAASDLNIRGGVLSLGEGKYTQFLVTNKDGIDLNINKVGLLDMGEDLTLILKRTAGKFTLMIENQKSGNRATLSLEGADYLDDAADMYVGFFGANTQSSVAGRVIVRRLKVTVWTISV